MSLNSCLYSLTEYQKNIGFQNRFEIKQTFFHTQIIPRIVIIINTDSSSVFKVYKPKDILKICAPCSLESLSRGNGTQYPHGMHDKLKYLCWNENEKKNKSFRQFLKNLEAWTAKDPDRRLRALMNYIKSGTIETDIQKAGLTVKQEDFIAFEFETNGKICSPWLDEKLIDSYIDFYDSVLGRRSSGNVCYVTGSDEVYTASFPRAFSKVKGKYLSRKDEYGSVWHGRFQHADEVAGISARAAYYIYWALDYAINFCSTLIPKEKGKNQKLREVYYAMVPVNFDLVIPLNVGFIELAGLYGFSGTRYEDFDAVTKTMEDRVGETSVLLFLGIKQQSDGKVSIVRYQEYRYKEIVDGVRNYVAYFKRTSLIEKVVYKKSLEGAETTGKRKRETESFCKTIRHGGSLIDIVRRINHCTYNGEYDHRDTTNDEQLFELLQYSVWEGRIPVPLERKTNGNEIRKMLSVSNGKAFLYKLESIVSLCLLKEKMGLLVSDNNRFLWGRILGLADVVYMNAHKNMLLTPIQREIVRRRIDMGYVNKVFYNSLYIFKKEQRKYLEDERRNLTTLFEKEGPQESELSDILIGYYFEINLIKEEIWRCYRRKLYFC